MRQLLQLHELLTDMVTASRHPFGPLARLQIPRRLFIQKRIRRWR